MRNWSYIFDHANFKTGSLQCSDCSLSACAGAFYKNIYGFQPVLHCRLCSGFGRALCSKRRRFSGASKSKFASRSPRKCITLYIGNGYDRVVEGGLDMGRSALNVLFFATTAGGSSFITLSSQILFLLLTSSCSLLFSWGPYGYARWF